MQILRKLVPLLAACVPLCASAASAVQNAPEPIINVGSSGLWMLANISYAGMRAQNSSSTGWRIVAFIFGFPGTFVSFFAIREGSGRAYGIVLPNDRSPPGA